MRISLKQGNSLSFSLLIGAISILSSTLICSKSHSADSFKESAIKDLRALQIEQTQRLQDLTLSINKLLKDTTGIHIHLFKENHYQHRLQKIQMDLHNRTNERRDYILRRRVVDQTLAIVEAYPGNDEISFKDYLQTHFLKMSQREVLQPQPDKSLWTFLMYQSIAIRELVAPAEDPIRFFITYMNDSGIANAKNPYAYLAQLQRNRVQNKVISSAEKSDQDPRRIY